MIPEDMQPRLWAFIGGIARKNGMKALMVGGMEEHIHALLMLQAEMSAAKAAQLIKAGSSKWCNQNLKGRRFEWQKGYGAFGVSASHVDATVAYIRNQKEHHRKRDYKQEFEEFLRKNGVEFDHVAIWD